MPTAAWARSALVTYGDLAGAVVTQRVLERERAVGNRPPLAQKHVLDQLARDPVRAPISSVFWSLGTFSSSRGPCRSCSRRGSAASAPRRPSRSATLARRCSTAARSWVTSIRRRQQSVVNARDAAKPVRRARGRGAMTYRWRPTARFGYAALLAAAVTAVASDTFTDSATCSRPAWGSGRSSLVQGMNDARSIDVRGCDRPGCTTACRGGHRRARSRPAGRAGAAAGAG